MHFPSYSPKVMFYNSSPAGCRFRVVPWADSGLLLARHYLHYFKVVLLVTLSDCMRRLVRIRSSGSPGLRQPSAKSGCAGRAEQVLLTGSACARVRVLTETRAGPSIVRSESASSRCKPASLAERAALTFSESQLTSNCERFQPTVIYERLQASDPPWSPCCEPRRSGSRLRLPPGRGHGFQAPVPVGPGGRQSHISKPNARR